MDIEAKKAQEKYGHFNSTHEAYAVLKEEVEEFWDLVKLPTLIEGEKYPFDAINNKKQKMISELNQIRSVTERIIEELENKQIKFI